MIDDDTDPKNSKKRKRDRPQQESESKRAKHSTEKRTSKKTDSVPTTDLTLQKTKQKNNHVETGLHLKRIASSPPPAVPHSTLMTGTLPLRLFSLTCGLDAEAEIDMLLNLQKRWKKTEMVTMEQKCPRREELKGRPRVDPGLKKKHGGCLPLTPASDLVLVRASRPPHQPQQGPPGFLPLTFFSG